MATADTVIANLALTHLGVGKEIADLETENSSEANAIRRVFETARDYTIRAFAWPFATKYADLTLIETDPNLEWGFSYVYPPDCLRDLKILSGIRNDTRQSRVPYETANNRDSLLIFTDMENATLKYLVQVTNVTLFPSDFVMAMSYRLGYLVAPRLTKGDPFKVGQMCLQMFKESIGEARANAINENQAEEEPESELIRARE